jgi:4-carboxymuconolactone decarboxylase
MSAVEPGTHEVLSALSVGDGDVLATLIGIREAHEDATGLDSRTFALVKIAALIAIESPPASYAWQIANALEEGATPEDILGVLRAVAPQVGLPRVVSAAPEIMLALGLALPEGVE